MKKKISVFHIDDNKLEIDFAKKIFEGFAEIIYSGNALNPEEGVEMIFELKPDILFLDIEMHGEKDGFWVAEKIKDTKTLIVFLTSHDEFMAKAFEACAMHYILKPIAAEMVAEVLNRQQKFQSKVNLFQPQQITELLENYIKARSKPQRIFIHNLGKTLIVDIEKLIYCVSSGSCTIFKNQDGSKYTSSKLIRVYEEALKNHPDFIRVHRSYIINRHFVKAILRNKHKMSLQMSDGTEIEVSPKLRDDIEKLLVV